MLRCCRFMRERERERETAHAQRQLIYPERNLLDDAEENTNQIYRNVFPTLCSRMNITDKRCDCLYVFWTSRSSDGSGRTDRSGNE